MEIKMSEVYEIVAFTKYAKVLEDDGDTILAMDLDSEKKFKIKGTGIRTAFKSSDAFSVSYNMNRTEIVEKLISAGDTPFTVVFVKKDGKLRTLRGRLCKDSETTDGRSQVEDLDKKQSDRIRQVDHRTIKSLIIDGTRYVAK
jgi:hypothetical protein